MFAWSGEASLAALFASAFLSATILPGNSEVVLFVVLREFPSQVALALALATVGNTLGSMTTYALGRLVPDPGTANRALAWVRRYGAAALLLAWLPVVGDALCAAAGALRVRWAVALAALAAGKLARYLVVAHAAHLF
jgi:membrane protein YqaA with SNARE-associated domain